MENRCGINCKAMVISLLYSVGEDGGDNGGDGTRAKAVTVGGWDWAQTRDIVWPRMATAKEVADYLQAQKQKAATGRDSD